MSSTDFTDSSTVILAAWLDDVDVATYASLSSVAGTNTITATGPVPMSAYASGQLFRFIPAGTNTGATTINITPSSGSALGAKNIFSGGVACVGGELVSAVPALIQYDGTQFNLINKAITNSSTSSTLTFDGSGGSSGAVTISWTKCGQWVTLSIPAVTATTGTGSVALTSNTALAAAVRPAEQQYFVLARVVNNGSAISGGSISINPNGTLSIYRDGIGTAFTNTASAGTDKVVTISYFIG